MSDLILFNKPFNVLSQFTDEGGRPTLASYIMEPGFYPAGRLDQDSEGLLILTDCGITQQRISDPRYKMGKVYWAQLEGLVTEEALVQLRTGVQLKDGMTRPAQAQFLPEPVVWSRTPPIRERKLIPTSWIELTLYEGRNRQVRRMTAALGFPTLRLIRRQINQWDLGDLQPGEWRKVSIKS